MSAKITIRVYFKSGQVIEFKADSANLEKNRLTGELTKVEWDGCVKPFPRFIDLNEVAAVEF